jgi:hypothetical protein
MNAVIDGLFAGGATQVEVVDGHGSGNPDPGEVEWSRLVWTAGMAAWEPAERQPEFAPVIAPPPLPA